MTIDELKIRYNKLLERQKRAEKFLDEVATREEQAKWFPEFQKIIHGLNRLILQYEKMTGQEMTNEEIINGFKGV